MSKSLPILLVLALLLSGTVVYLGFRIKQSKTVTAPPPQDTTLSGHVLLGEDSDRPMAYCTEAYYLVSGNRADWLVGKDLEQYKYAKVEITGSNRQEDSPCNNPETLDCGCDYFIVPQEIKIVEDASILKQKLESRQP